MNSATPPSLGDYVFGGCTNLSTIYVPDEDILVAYEAVAPWNNYTIIPKTYNSPLYFITQTEALLQQMPDDWSNHGLLTNASQLSSNKVERTEGSLAGLLDGNADTYFHSTWSSANTSNVTHYLQADLGHALQHLQLKYLRRNHQNNAEPKTIRVFATNDPTLGWTETGVAHLPTGTGSETLDLGSAYRYVRFNVEATQNNPTRGGNLFFTWAELGIWNAAGITDDLRQEAEALLATARAEQEADALSSATLEALVAMNERLVRGDYLRIKDGGNNFRYTEAQSGYDAIHYERNFTHTGWQALYVPFDMSYDDLSDDYTVAALNNLHQFDDDADGLFDRTYLEVRYLRSGDVVKANTPYVIRANATGMQTLVAAGAELQPMEEESIDCSSTLYRYIFSGTYTGMSGADMLAGSFYAMSGGALSQAESDAAALGAYRWYMAVESRTASTTALSRHITIVESGADLTGIEAVEMETDTMDNAPVYDLNGRLVGRKDQMHHLPKGVYIINGKKVLR